MPPLSSHQVNTDDAEDIAALWQSALKEYEKDTDRQSSSQKKRTFDKTQTVEDIFRDIMSFSETFEAFRSRKRGLWNKLKSFASPLQTVLNLAATSSVVADAFGMPISTIISACVYLIKGCEGVSDAYDWIEQLFTELQEFSERLGLYAQHEIITVLKSKVVAILAFILRVLGRAEQLIQRERFRQYLRVTFLGQDDKTKSLVDNLNKLFESEQRFVLAITYAVAQDIKTTVVGTHDKVDEINKNLSELVLKANEAKDKEQAVENESILRTNLCDTSAASDVVGTFAVNKRSLVKGTGEWLGHEDLYKAWNARQASILWVFGGPGVGKSYLSTWIVQQLAIRKPDPVSYAYFFVKKESEVLRDANIILKTLAWQLSSQDLHFRSHAAEVCQHAYLVSTADDTWENVFLAYYAGRHSTTRCAVLVIDGLDEATKSTRRTLLKFVKDTISESASSDLPAIQFSIAARPSIRDELLDFRRQEKGFIIDVNRTKNESDINRYVSKRLEELSIFHKLRKSGPSGMKQANDYGREFRKKTLRGCDGVFLWAKLLIDEIKDKHVAHIRSVLDDPPATLDDMIREVFKRLANDNDIDHDILRTMLSLCIHSQRPLTLGELELFLSLPHLEPDLLLWEQTRGKLSSVFDLKYPLGYDPDEEQESGDGDTGVGLEDSDQEFDFNGTDDEDTDEPGDDDDDDSEFATDTKPETISPGQIVGRSYLTTEQKQTKIVFCHVRIRDFLIHEGNQNSGNDILATFLPSTVHAHADIAIICLDVLKLELSVDYDTRFLTEYTLRYLTVHLESIDIRSISDDKYLRIIKGLYWLLGSERGAYCLIMANQWLNTFHATHSEFYQAWAGEETNLRLVQVWFAELARRRNVCDRLEPDAQTWMAAATGSYDTLLKPLMLAASRLWLTRSGWDDTGYDQKGEFPCWLLHGWLCLSETGHVSQDIPGFSYSQSWCDFGLLSSQRLKTLASWAGLPQDAHWHTGLGWILAEGGYYEEAVVHYQNAITLDKHAWVSLEGLASIYGQQKGLLQQAVDCMQQAFEVIPEKVQYLSASPRASLAGWCLELGLIDQAFLAAHRAFDLYPLDIRSQMAYLKGLEARNDLATIRDTVMWLNARIEEGTEHSWLVRSFIIGFDQDTYDAIGRAIRDDNQSTWILAAMEAALEMTEVVTGDESISLPFHFARFSHEWFDNHTEETIRLAEMFLERLGQKTLSVKAGFEYEMAWIEKMLAQLYFDQAVKLHVSGDESSAYAGKLKLLATSVHTSFAEDYDGFDFYQEGYPSLLWGRWLRQYQKADGAVWRKCFKARLLRQMDTLDDQDPSNDQEGIYSLAKSLAHAGDDENAASIRSVLFGSSESLQLHDNAIVLVKDGAETEQSHGGSWQKLNGDQRPCFVESLGDQNLPLAVMSNLCRCDNCRRHVNEVKQMYGCVICHDVDWCNDCLPMVKDHSIRPGLKKHLCSPSHVFYQEWPVTEETRTLATRYTDGRVYLKRSWLEALRSEWLQPL